MNLTTIIGNLTKNPELRTTTSGKQVCNFTVAVNSRKQDQEAVFFRVGAFDKLADNCQKYLAKGKKVCVVGSVSARAYLDTNGKPAAVIDLMAHEVEFLSPKENSSSGGGYTVVDDLDSPF